MESEKLSSLLAQLGDGDESARRELFPLVYGELRALADRVFRQLPLSETLQPTALAHEAYLRLVTAKDQRFENRAHFLAVAAKAMRQLLLDYARGRKAQKRGGQDWRRVTLDEALAAVESTTVDVLTLDETLGRLSALNQRQAQIVEMRVFGGLTIDETACALGVGSTTVKADWVIARAWLRREVQRDSPS